MNGLAVDLVLALLLLLAAVCAQRLVADLRTLPRAGSGPGARPRTVSVVVPARDEAETLPHLLAAVRDQDPAPLEVVVVDDASRDATAEVARTGGAEVVPAGSPPPGWTGKAWACRTGVDATTGDLLLFLDADTVLAADALAGLLDVHARHGGLVSVQPHHAVVRPYEQLSAYFNVVAVMASGAFTRAAGTARQRHVPMAFGPCLLTSRADYEAVGGHAAVRAEILDDAALAAAYDRAGLPVRCAIGGDAVRMRSYPGGLRQLVAGWTKNIASGASSAAPAATAATVGWISAHHAVAVGALGSLVAATTGSGSGLVAGSALLWAVAYVATALHLRWVLRRTGSFRWWAWALFPVPLLAFDLVFARSLALTVVRGSVSWRGRDVPLAEAPEGVG
ncbi:4,4'-diaponeurosporenoate glycosyltransferase [Nocardioides flavus (ex Wang et al. 2016)]|uniref:4,4'-diaponeurosporenoate glycosyltransferase n=1 Tax=Nocardioides flavus (ex Wang et al. 2016) TaxID=2058780 RepID=A0ABQ3HMR1_9ACTN|nr:glycosyltransferase family 2 protein [Nocardioides flavus (ex Wang et al. 2016)]GHE17130.1 4,4'-diaponeurosporenoate glycosyltransferase [Nocardioides flavus (ex Wang et al. 2016)]